MSLRASVRVPAGRPRPKTNARASMGPFIGRADVLAEIDALFDRGCRIVTLLGPPGMGKTRVAEKWLELRARDYEGGGGAWFCDLTQARDEHDLVHAVISAWREKTHALQVPENDVDDELGETLSELGPTVLVLDNFEQITHAARAVSSWCGAAPELCVLVTSRERLAIAGEEVIELGPLGCPNESAGATDVLESEAVRLFSARARAAGGDVGDDTRALARLVRRLDGIPLAIELAAARTRVMRPKDLAARFEEKRDLLGALTSAIDWSWDLLSEREQSALASCSVFAGSFGAAAAEKVVGGDDAVELVAALRDKSLLFATEGGRLALYVSIREYAEKKLAAMGADEPRLAHLRHARAYAEAVRPFNEARTFQGAAPDAELRVELTRDKENLLAALAFMEREAERKGGNLDAEEARVRSELAVGVALLQAAPAEACIDALSGALDREIDTPLRVRILLARQSLWNSLARFQECRADLKALIEIPDTPRGVRILGLVMQGTQLRYQGLPRDAWQSHEEAARELATLDLPRMLAMNTACMGRLKIDFYEPAAARELNERARAIAASVGDRWMAGLPLANLAQLEQEEGNYEKAAARLDDAMQRFRESSEPHYVGVYASALGDLYFEWGKPDVARRWYDEAASFFGRFAAHRQTAVLHAAASALEATYGDVTDALAHLELAKKSASRGESPIVRLVVEAHGASLELRVARDSKDPKALEATLERWRARVRAIDEGKAPDTEHATKSIDGRFATRILRRSLAHFSTSTSTSTSTATSTATATPTSTSTSTSTPTPTAILRIAPDYARFEIGSKKADIERRGSLKRILRALVELHATKKDAALDRDALLEHGWPGEKLHPDAASKRLRVAIATLRSLGLREVLRTRDDGYLLDRDATIDVS